MTHAGIRPSLHALPDLHGHGLRLRPWDPESEADVDVWFRGRTDPEFRRWNTPLRITTDLDSARDCLCDVARNAAEGTSAPYCVTDGTTGAPLGHIGVNVINRVVGSARVGYWVLPEAAAVASPRTRSPSSPAGPSPSRAWACTASNSTTWEAGRHDAYRDMHLHARLAEDPDVEV